MFFSSQENGAPVELVVFFIDSFLFRNLLSSETKNQYPTFIFD